MTYPNRITFDKHIKRDLRIKVKLTTLRCETE